jgi:hypothetical protein
VTGLIERWDGVRWSVQQAPTPPGSQQIGVSDVSCVSQNHCIALGYEILDDGGDGGILMLVWNGVDWSAQPSPAVPFSDFGGLDGLSCVSQRFCMAGGPGAGNHGVAGRWDDGSWTFYPAITGISDGVSVSCVSTTDCTALNSLSGASRWNGSRWSRDRFADQDGQYGTPDGISCPSSRFCVAVGSVINDVGGSIEYGHRMPQVMSGGIYPIVAIRT